jgi:hypothetical protein
MVLKFPTLSTFAYFVSIDAPFYQVIKYIYIYSERYILDRIKIMPRVSAPQSPSERYTIAWIRRTITRR